MLVLNSYHQGYEWTDAQVSGITSALRANSPAHEIFIEYLDLRRLGADQWNAIATAYGAKYAGRPLDIVVATDDYAVQFLLNRPQLFPGVPMIFSGVNEYKGSSAFVYRNHDRAVAGVLETIDVRETARAALVAQPGANAVVTIGEADDADYVSDIVRDNAQLRVWRLNTQRLTADELARSLRTLPKGAVVVFSAFSRDSQDRQFTVEQSTRFVVENSSVPVYGLNRYTLGLGIVGGKLVDGFAYGTRAGEMAVRVLSGTPASKLGVEIAENRFQFDDRQLRRWGIDPKRLPDGSLIINQPRNFLREHWVLALVIATCLTVQAFIIALLVLSRSRQRRAQAEVEVSESRFRRLADSMPQMVWTASNSGLSNYCNAGWREYTGLQAGQVSTFSELLVHPDESRAAAEAWEASVATGEPLEILQRLRRSDGVYRWHLTRAMRVEVNGRTEWLGTSTDIDAQKRTESALRSANRDLEQFAYSVSHDLQEPLRMVAVYCQLLQRRYEAELPSEGQVFVQYVRQGADRMSLLLKDLLAYTRVALSETDHEAECNTAAVFESVKADLQSRIEDSGAVVEAITALPVVKAAHVHVYQLFLNLVTNAMKYHSDQAPRIELTAVLTGNQWRFSARDNGIGIAPAYHERVFGLFRRLHGREEYPGTGLGLALCEKIVSRYGGEIWVESELGAGATFFFTLPAALQVAPLGSPTVCETKPIGH